MAGPTRGWWRRWWPGTGLWPSGWQRGCPRGASPRTRRWPGSTWTVSPGWYEATRRGRRPPLRRWPRRPAAPELTRRRWSSSKASTGCWGASRRGTRSVSTTPWRTAPPPSSGSASGRWRCAGSFLVLVLAAALSLVIGTSIGEAVLRATSRWDLHGRRGGRVREWWLPVRRAAQHSAGLRLHTTAADQTLTHACGCTDARSEVAGTWERRCCASVGREEDRSSQPLEVLIAQRHASHDPDARRALSSP